VLEEAYHNAHFACFSEGGRVYFLQKRIRMRFSLAPRYAVPEGDIKAHYNALEYAMTPQEIGQKFRTRRKVLHLRQRDLAELAGVTLRGLTSLERGQANPTLKQLAKIADVLGLEFNLIERSRHASS
jgi:DNA-binding XRE family transcriptional regulator